MASEIGSNPEWRVLQNNWSVKTMLGMYNRSRFDFNSRIQRGEVWDLEDKSEWIYSILWGMPSMGLPLYSRRGKIYRCIDGKQRSMALFEFIQGKYALKGIKGEMVFSEEQGEMVDINNLKFSQLEQSMQDRIMDFMFSVAVLESTNGTEVTEDIEAEFFRRANGGKTVSKTDIAMSAAKCMEAVLEVVGQAEYDRKNRPIPQKNFFVDAYGIKRFKAMTLPKEIVLKSFYLLCPGKLKEKDDSPLCISTTKLSRISKDMIITGKETQILKDTFNKIKRAREIVVATEISKVSSKIVARRATSKIALLSYIQYIYKFDSDKQLAEWMIYLFRDKNKEREDASHQGTNAADKVKKRDDYYRKAIEDFLADYDNLSKTFDFKIKDEAETADSTAEEPSLL